MIALWACPIPFQVIIAFPDANGGWGNDKIRHWNAEVYLCICAGFLAYLSRKQAEQPVLSCSEQQAQPRKEGGREGGAVGRGLGKAVASGGSELTGTAPEALSSPIPPQRLPSPQPTQTPAGHVAVASLSQRDS